ncbi:PREDICTED: putative B3 domain-containing protein At5g35780 [Camelina sativa]|uniref:B3 domain-containing protein At5g35780 n=1 Tax=Camelina sativa TaxID=90675 RepID=A0ABM0V5S1_CAMSA|nr:PREDICTED: putative B3 domain-containing protein At5g35780 [Camelina sativa]
MPLGFQITMKTYEDDLESMKKNMWSNLYELADVATKVYEDEQRKKKGKSKIVSEEEEDDDERFRFLDYVPKKIRSSLRYSQQRNYENLNGDSTSSSSSLRDLRCFETRSWLHYNTAEIESPPNPNSQSSSCLTESTSRKSRALVPQPRSSSGKFKKTKVVASLPRIARGTPEWLVEVMREMGVADEDPMLIFEKPLSASDVKSDLSRLLLPFSMLTTKDFLTPAEYAAIRRQDIEEENIGVGTILVNKKSEMHYKKTCSLRLQFVTLFLVTNNCNVFGTNL